MPLRPLEHSPQHVILVIDDDRFVLKMFHSILSSKGYLPITASNGFEGYNVARNTKPDLILLDIMMPRMDGFQTLQKIRTDPEISEIPIIIVTAKADTNTFLKALKLGANDFIAKPFSRGDLLRKIRIALKHGQQQGNKEEQLFPMEATTPLSIETFIDNKTFPQLQKNFVRKFNDTFLKLVRLVSDKAKYELRRELEHLKNACEYYEFNKAARLLEHALQLIDKEDWHNLVTVMDNLYTYFQSAQQVMVVNSKCDD